MQIRSVVVVAALGLASFVHGQQAVQWRVEDGGNGHWYRWVPYGSFATWTGVETLARKSNGHLATITSAQEEAYVRSLFQSGSCVGCSGSSIFIGAFQDPALPDYAEPGGGWRWVTGEAWEYTNWYPGEPNNNGNAEDYLALRCAGQWGDGSNEMPCNAAALIEWSADCNGDGIVDYGQILDGSLPDYNGNNKPDCCEAGMPCVVGNYPVQWQASDGGNGHWYQFVPVAVPWSTAQSNAVARGGYLVCLTSQAENAFVNQVAPGRYLAGGFQPPNTCEPACGWQWVSGEPWAYTNWSTGEPNNLGEEDYLNVNLGFPGWNDVRLEPIEYLIEWSADCNNDGIVDYGQILDGTFADNNANGVPDCCDAGTPCLIGDIPVQWREEDGGNGHWYRFVEWPSVISWEVANAQANADGGYLATLTSQAENSWVYDLVANQPLAWDCSSKSVCSGTSWLGGYQQPGACEPGCGWTWITGEPWTFAAWSCGQPNAAGPDQNYLHFYWYSGCGPERATWDDVGPYPAMRTAIFEWSTDCNNDGIVDYGQILDGTFADTDANGVPDCCDAGESCSACPGDVNDSGIVNGTDIAIILGAWGTSGGKFPRADTDGNGIVDATDLAVVLGGWGNCP